MKYLKTYEGVTSSEQSVISMLKDYGYEDKVQEETNTFDDVLNNCKPFIKDLSECDRGSFLVRGIVLEGSGVKKFKHNMNHRVPRDMPSDVHQDLNDEFENEFGWKVRNGAFCFGRFYNPKKEGIYSKTYNQMKTSYGKQSYLFFPIGDYDIVWSREFDDLYSDLELEGNLYGANEDSAYEDWQYRFGEGEDGTWWCNGRDTGESDRYDAIREVADNYEDYGYDWDKEKYEDEEDFKDDLESDISCDLEWEPGMTWDDFWDDYQYQHEGIDIYRVVSEFESGNLNKAIISQHEICVKCNEYYMVEIDDDTFFDIMDKIWGKEKAKN